MTKLTVRGPWLTLLIYLALFIAFGFVLGRFTA